MIDPSELGIDEAGRGPVLGPLILAGVVIPQSQTRQLLEWGVKDSKAFGSSQKAKTIRADLSRKIRDHFRHEIVVLPSSVVDQYVRETSLNHLEQVSAQNIIDNLAADSVILDGKSLFAPLVQRNIIALNKADSIYISVGAASILAKAERDRLFHELCRPYQDLFGEIAGGGYANHKTLDFVKWHLKSYGELPPFYRSSYQWKELSMPITGFQTG